jgi:formate transporter
MTERDQNPQDTERIDRPLRQFFIPSQIVQSFAEKGKDHLEKNVQAHFILSLKAGAFMTFGAVFSVLLVIGIEPKGLVYLLSGLGFATGYAMVFLSGAVLFTEVNVLLPTYLLQRPNWVQKRYLKFWISTYLGNIAGAFFAALIIMASSSMTPEFSKELDVFLGHKMGFLENGVWGWFQILLSGIVANWLIGMAAFLTTAARDLLGKIIGTALPVILFVAGNFQHSAANMGYFSLGVLVNHKYTWYEYLFLNLIPASIGNIIGGAILVSLLFSYAYRKEMVR